MARNDDSRLSGRARTIAGAAVLVVVLVIILADAFGWAESPDQVYLLMVFIGVFFFGVRIKDWFGGGTQ